MSEEEQWDTPEFERVRALVDEFMESEKIPGIANGTHGEYVSKQFHAWMQRQHPAVYTECANKEHLYYMALLDWNMDNYGS